MKKSSSPLPDKNSGRAAGQRSGRFGFLVVILSMLGAASVLGLGAGGRSALPAWGSLGDPGAKAEAVLPSSGFMVVDMSSVYSLDEGRKLTHRTMKKSLDEDSKAALEWSFPENLSVNQGDGPLSPFEKSGVSVVSEFGTSMPGSLPVEGQCFGMIGAGAVNGGESRLGGFDLNDGEGTVLSVEDMATLLPGKMESDYDDITLSEISDGRLLPFDEGEEEPAAEEEEVHLTEVRSQWKEHLVKAGETMSDIAISYGVPLCDIVKANELKNPDRLAEKQLLLIPESTEAVDATLEEVLTRKARVAAAREKVKPVKVTAYVVAQGDSLWSIANSHNLEIDSLYGSNDLKNPDLLKPGATLRIPNQDGVFYKVKKGDNLDKIGKAYGIPAERIKKGNDDGVLDGALKAGQEIFLPGARPATTVSAAQKKSGGISAGSRSYRWPVIGRINSPFGWRRHPITRRRDFHTGIDIKAPRGRVIKAAKAGRVEYAGWMGGYGRVVVVRHNDGLSTLYAHCSSLSVRNGQSVSQGQTIARVGTTGRTTGPHLHFEVRKGKSPTNPLKLLK
ncbi:MAG: peptidoglycan DD-metalloendopeptidase family protein [Aminivibrio sp.]|jgi:murein DD-endopeptidase MepM/ murein hydrolase activator NlpD